LNASCWSVDVVYGSFDLTLRSLTAIFEPFNASPIKAKICSASSFVLILSIFLPLKSVILIL
jgi:hypothetical protein